MSRSRVKSVDMHNQDPLFLTISSSTSAKNTLNFVQVEKETYTYRHLQKLEFDVVIQDAVAAHFKNQMFIFVIGFTMNNYHSENCLYFYQSMKMQDLLEGKAQFTPKLNTFNERLKSLQIVGEDIYALSDDKIHSFNLIKKKFTKHYQHKDNTIALGEFQRNPKSPVIYVSQQNSIHRIEQGRLSATLPSTHLMDVNSISVNTNKQHQILTTANENFVKFWDLRKPSQPNFVLNHHQSLVTTASFNKFYDQVVLFATDSGNLFLYGANDISSRVLISEKVPENRLLHQYSFVLDDYVQGGVWSENDAWLFAATTRGKGYFDVIQQGLKFEIMF